jgi:hypothetical protein
MLRLELKPNILVSKMKVYWMVREEGQIYVIKYLIIEIYNFILLLNFYLQLTSSLILLTLL